MPRGRPKKVKEPEAPEVTKPSALESFRAALNEAITEDPEATKSALAAVLGVAQGTQRTVSDERPRKVPASVARELVAELPDPPLPPPEPGVTFMSGSKGAWQVVKPGQKKFYGDGNVEIIPPVVKQAENGVVRLTDPSEIEAMRAKIAKQRARGERPLFVEISAEVAKTLAKGRSVDSIKSNKVTVETPMADLVTA